MKDEENKIRTVYIPDVHLFSLQVEEYYTQEDGFVYISKNPQHPMVGSYDTYIRFNSYSGVVLDFLSPTVPGWEETGLCLLVKAGQR